MQNERDILLRFVIVLGIAVALVGHLWLSTMAAVSVDAILTPEELRDDALVDVVYRTHEFVDYRLLLPYYVLGLLLVYCGISGVYSLRRTPSTAQRPDV